MAVKVPCVLEEECIPVDRLSYEVEGGLVPVQDEWWPPEELNPQISPVH